MQLKLWIEIHDGRTTWRETCFSECSSCRPRQKRKRPKASPDGVEATSGKKTKATNGVEVRDEDGEEAFDFSAVPNILDDNTDLADSDATKKKKKRERREKKGERDFIVLLFSINAVDTYYPNLHRRLKEERTKKNKL